MGQIKSLLLLLVIAIGASFSLIGFMLYFYGSSGTYKARDMLIEPDLVEELSYNDLNSVTGASSRYIFKEIAFTAYDSKNKERKRQLVPMGTYIQLYHLIEDKKSIDEKEITPSILAAFDRNPPALLTVAVETVDNSPNEKNSKIIQKVEFAFESSYFRIELQQQPPSNNRWVYFESKAIYQTAVGLFLSTGSSHE